LKDILKPFWAVKGIPEEGDMRTQSGKAKTKFEARNPKRETNSGNQNRNVLNKSRAKTLAQVAVVLMALVVCLFACAGKSASSKFFVLSPLPQTKPSAADDKTIGVFPVAMPDYLDRPQIVTRVSENEIKIDEFNRWAAPLKENFYTVLVDNLSALLNSEKVLKTTQKLGALASLQVGVEVVQFDGTLGGDAVLVAKWGLFEQEGKKLLSAKRSSFREPTGAATYEALVAAQSRAAAALSREIAEAIKAKK
jgi:hypothetical protein